MAEPAFEPERQRHKETVFTIGNGNFCVRGSFEEGYPGENAASFMHRVWDDMPINFTELANLPRWWGVDIWANGVRFRLDRGKALRYRRWLDLRTGVLSRTVRWQPEPDGPVLDLRFERFVNLADPHQAAVQVQIAVVEGQADVRVRTGLNAHVENTGLVHWDLIAQEATADALAVQVRTRATKTNLAVAAAVEMNLSPIHSPTSTEDVRAAANESGRGGRPSAPTAHQPATLKTDAHAAVGTTEDENARSVGGQRSAVVTFGPETETTREVCDADGQPALAWRATLRGGESL
ncbi:MAG: hypothetical protein WHX53_07150, partial [Anaerolineae bacterium]